MPDLIGLCYRVAAENVVLQNSGEMPGQAGIGGIAPTALPEVGGDIIELPPGNCHLVRVRRVNRNRTFVSRVAEDIVSVCIDVDLVTDEPVVH